MAEGLSYPWCVYAHLQHLSRTVRFADGSSSEIDDALNFVLSSIESGEVSENPADFDVAIARVMATAARRDRSRRVQRTVEFASEPRAIDIVANLEARAEIERLARSIGHADYGLLRLIGEGWSYKEITVKIGGTEMTLRVKVSRLRGKLAA